MYTIKITKSTESLEDMAGLLEYIAEQIKEGNTAGYHPGWTVSCSDDE